MYARQRCAKLLVMTLDALTASFPPAFRTLPAILQRGAESYGDAPLVSIGVTQWSHQQALDRVAAHAGNLRRSGLRAGDAIALMCGNLPQQLESFLAAGWLGAIAVPINTASMAPQIQYFLADSQARLLVIEATYLDRLVNIDWTKTGIEAIWVVGTGEADLTMPETIPITVYPEPGIPVEPAAVNAGDTLAILYTSGTTGPPKGVMCPHAQYFWWGAHCVDALSIDASDTLCTALPLFHINALHTFCQASLSGAQVRFLSRFSASRYWSTMQEHGGTVGYLLGAMAPMLLAQPESAVERQHKVRCILSPGTPAAAARALQERTGVIVIEGFGSTETNFALGTRFDTEPRGIMGWVRPHFEARVVDEHDTPLADGQAGELVLRAEQPFAFATGYFNMPDKTVEAWRNLWFHTGDRVVREPDGAFRFLDRLKDSIRRRGENISSYEVEAVLLSHPLIAAAAVFPVKSELAEDEVMATIALRATDNERQTPSFLPELAKFCKSRLPYFAVPRYIDIVAELPRTASGKIQKYILRERGITTSTWDRMTERDAPGKLHQ